MKLIQIEIVELANNKFAVETKDFSDIVVTVGEAQFAKHLKNVLKKLMKKSEKSEV